MCGLFFVVQRGYPINEARFRRALGLIKHRGPDGTGIALVELAPRAAGDPSIAIAAGHQRLAILDPKPQSDQPFERDGQTLVYNGEIYNFRALRSALAAQHGRRFTTDGDTEVLSHMLRLHGLAGLAEAQGMWAFCALDEQQQSVTAARDRLGKKPLFYYADAQTLCFASEIAPINAFLGRTPQLTVADLDTYLAHGWLMPTSAADATATPVVGIRQVTPGGFVTVDLATWDLRTGTYCASETFAPLDRPPSAPLADLLRQAVTDRLVSDRPIGLLLSGGIDSSLILSILCAGGLQDQVTCFTGDAGKSEDALYAARTTEALGIKAEVVPLDYGVAGKGGGIEWFVDVCRHQEKPFPMIGNVLGLPQLYAAIADRGVPVVLDGTGADEVFGGYWERYYRFALAEALAADDTAWVNTMLAANVDHPRINAIGQATRTAHAQRSWPPPTTVGAELSAEVRAQIDTYCRPEVASAQPSDSLARFKGTLSQALHHDVTQGLLPEWLWQNDRNAMRSGVENRSPFLDTRLTALLGTRYATKFHGPWNKHELRRAFDDFVPAPTQWRREKQGFRWVFARFLRQNRIGVMALIAASRTLKTRVNVDVLLDAIARDEEVLFSDLTQRALCIAGLEAATELGVA